MTHDLAAGIVLALAAYLVVGAVVGVAFALAGARHVDPRAIEGTWGFRLIILPGAVALWPVVLRRWRRGGPPPGERNAHRDLARGAEGG